MERRVGRRHRNLDLAEARSAEEMRGLILAVMGRKSYAWLVDAP
jgi:hypothetical protein